MARYLRATMMTADIAIGVSKQMMVKRNREDGDI